MKILLFIYLTLKLTDVLNDALHILLIRSEMVVNAFPNNNDQVITGSKWWWTKCFAPSDGMQDYYSHEASNLEGIDASILFNECITRNNKYSSFFYEIIV